MKLIKQSFEFINQTDFSLVGIKKFIEKCGRVCYKSEDKITDSSYLRFVDMLIKNHHDRPLEFGTVHLKVPSGKEFKDFIKALVANKLYNFTWIKFNKWGKYTYVTTNYRMYLRMLKEIPYCEKYFTEEDSENYYARYTIHFILDRVTMDSFRTHVGLSHLGESTRYCNYSKDKFNKEITFIKPEWCDIPTGEYELFEEDSTIDGLTIHHIDGNKNPLINTSNATKAFLRNCDSAETNYFECLNNGWVPQQAREVLPLSVKSELISCGFEDAWSNFFYRRCAKDAHPMAREIAIPLQEKFLEIWKQE